MAAMGTLSTALDRLRQIDDFVKQTAQREADQAKTGANSLLQRASERQRAASGLVADVARVASDVKNV